ncbi:hypothetical protein ACFRLW_36745, partial [Streptomyces sp. NPDC056728]
MPDPHESTSRTRHASAPEPSEGQVATLPSPESEAAPSEREPTAEVATARSLLGTAWLRIRRSRIAVAALIVVALM